MAASTVFEKPVVLKELPKQSRAGGPTGPRSTPVTKALDLIVSDEKRHGKWNVVLTNENSGTTSGQATSLRKRFGGETYAQGWEFRVRQIEVDGKNVHALCAFYDPAAVVEGGMDKYLAEVAARNAKRTATKAANQGSG